MSLSQQIIMIGMVILGTVLTRLIPFIVFSRGKSTPAYVQYLGRVLPSAALGLLVIYCFRDINVFIGSRGFPELLSSAVVVGLHVWKKSMVTSIAGGTIFYMVLIRLLAA